MQITQNSSLNPHHRLVGILLLGWMGTIVWLGMRNAFVPSPGEAPLAILVSFVTTFLLFSVAYTLFPAFRDFLFRSSR